MQSCARALGAALRQPASAASAAAQTRGMASGKSRAVGLRLRYGGAVPGVRFGGRLSTEMRFRSESILESVRMPKPVVNPIARWRVLRGDLVQVTSGPLVGQRGRVLEVVRASNRVVVEGVGFVNKWVPQPDSSRKKKVRTEAPIPVSRVQVVCPETNRPTRVEFKFLEDGTKVRVAKRSGAVIPRPAVLAERRVPRPEKDGVKDTAPETVLERTYDDEDGLYDERYGGFVAMIDKVKL
jgi:large subunit ribosomal protein L24